MPFTPTDRNSAARSQSLLPELRYGVPQADPWHVAVLEICANQVVGEPGLEAGIGPKPPVHLPEIVRPLPGSEHILDTSAVPVDRPAPFGLPAFGLEPGCRIRSC